MRVYELAGEAIIWREAGPAANAPEGYRLLRDATPPDPGEVAQANRERVIRRAKVRARRFAATNGTTRLVTFTYRPANPCSECGASRPVTSCKACRVRVKRDWAAFARRLREAGHHVPWLRSVESHKDGSAHLHAAMALPSSWSKEWERRTRYLAGLWRVGFVDLPAERRPRPGTGRREMARAVARYVVKYAVKAIEDAYLDPGEHAYEVAEGFSPVAVAARTWFKGGAVAQAVRVMGGEVPRYQWESESCTEWTGPPVVFLGW